LTDDPRFATGPDRVAHREELNALIAKRCARSDADDLLKDLESIGIACAGVNDVAAFLDHPVLAARDRWREVAVPGGTGEALLPPARRGETPPGVAQAGAAGVEEERTFPGLAEGAESAGRPRADGAVW